MFYPGNLKLIIMEYNEMKELARKQLTELFNAGQMDEETQERMIVAFINGFLKGEMYQLNKRIQEA